MPANSTKSSSNLSTRDGPAITAVFWRFRPLLYEDYQAAYRNDGIVSRLSFPISNAPIVFTARSPRGIRSVVVRMAVAESALRRGILGVKFTKILDLS
jgi:hypothetical protein